MQERKMNKKNSKNTASAKREEQDEIDPGHGDHTSNTIDCTNRTATTEQQTRGIITPHPNDVISGRGAGANQHPGNVYYRHLIQSQKLNYLSSNPTTKKNMIQGIVDAVKAQSPSGRFLKSDPTTELWHCITLEQARRKTGQSFREDAPKLKKMKIINKYFGNQVKVPDSYQLNDVERLVDQIGRCSPTNPLPEEPMRSPNSNTNSTGFRSYVAGLARSQASDDYGLNVSSPAAASMLHEVQRHHYDRNVPCPNPIMPSSPSQLNHPQTSEPRSYPSILDQKMPAHELLRERGEAPPHAVQEKSNTGGKNDRKRSFDESCTSFKKTS